MKIWPFTKASRQTPRKAEFDPLVWETNTLAKATLAPMIKRFPQYNAVVESDLTNTWDFLMTIAMAGVAANAKGILSNADARASLRSSLDNKLHGGGNAFDNYYKYTNLRMRVVGASWSGVSAMWMTENLRRHNNANATFKQIADALEFVNPLAAFMDMSFGSTIGGFSDFLGVMTLEVEEKMGIDIGLGTRGTRRNPIKKVEILAEIFELFARNTVDMIAERKDLN